MSAPSRATWGRSKATRLYAVHTSPVADDITQLRQDEQALAEDRSADPADVPGDAPSAAQVQGAISAAQAASGSATGTGNAALTRAIALEQTAAGHQTRSDAACSAAGG